mmetsp:Transcript_22477/g.58701  ORF Transcript_22477/g.58701 Transcript_22477/m.58701 type:complete len:237 (+) Transcript_22477:710-1420(+)
MRTLKSIWSSGTSASSTSANPMSATAAHTSIAATMSSCRMALRPLASASGGASTAYSSRGGGPSAQIHRATSAPSRENDELAASNALPCLMVHMPISSSSSGAAAAATCGGDGAALAAPASAAAARLPLSMAREMANEKMSSTLFSSSNAVSPASVTSASSSSPWASLAASTTSSTDVPCTNSRSSITFSCDGHSTSMPTLPIFWNMSRYILTSSFATTRSPPSDGTPPMALNVTV